MAVRRSNSNDPNASASASRLMVASIQSRAPCEVVERTERPSCDDALDRSLWQPFNEPEPKPKSVSFQRAIPIAMVHVDGPHEYTVFPGIANELGW